MKLWIGFSESSYAKVDTDGSDALGFELYRRTVAQCGVQAVLVVEIDVAAHGRPQGAVTGEGLAVDQVGLQ